MCAVPNLYGSKKGVKSDNMYSVAVRRRTPKVVAEPVDSVHLGSRSVGDPVHPVHDFRAALGRLAPKGGVEFSGAVFHQLIGPGVYVWLRGDEALYVGASRTAFSRAASPRHHRIRLGKDVAYGDSVLFYSCATMADALELEAALIQALRPRFNHNGRWGSISTRLGFTRVGHFKRQYLSQLASEPAS
jgi:hypothetical protein